MLEGDAGQGTGRWLVLPQGWLWGFDELTQWPSTFSDSKHSVNICECLFTKYFTALRRKSESIYSTYSKSQHSAPVELVKLSSLYSNCVYFNVSAFSHAYSRSPKGVAPSYSVISQAECGSHKCSPVSSYCLLSYIVVGDLILWNGKPHLVKFQSWVPNYTPEKF